jgi:hypothetical protein
MKSLEHEHESDRMNPRANGMRELRRMMVGITSNKRNVGLLHFSMMIVFNPCFHNYVKRLPHQTLKCIQ